ncbi:MAG: CoA transferase, partial [Steroidobacteraceae bacterium]|nr:CoA transferase [Steroidobacteraceae bacterium]
CGMLLADLGADLIKVEPAQGDIARSIGQHSVGPHNAYFASLNRNKKSVVLDLASEQGQQALGELAASARGLITNLRPSAIHKLGLTYEHLKRWNPGIVCVALTGYGLEGPYADRPAYDYVIQALTGVMQITGEPGGPPAKTGYSAVDNSAAIMGAVGLLAKLTQGQGGQVDIAMYDTMLSQLNYLASAWLNAGEPVGRYAESAHPYIVPAQNFRTRDGWLVLFITHDDFWRLFCEELGRPQWLDDPAFATMDARRRNRERVVPAIAEVLADESTQHWLDRLTPLGLVVADVQSLESALASEHAVAREMVVDIPTEDGSIRAVGNPIKNRGAAMPLMRPPLLGEHNALISGGVRR